MRKNKLKVKMQKAKLQIKNKASNFLFVFLRFEF